MQANYIWCLTMTWAPFVAALLQKVTKMEDYKLWAKPQEIFYQGFLLPFEEIVKTLCAHRHTHLYSWGLGIAVVAVAIVYIHILSCLYLSELLGNKCECTPSQDVWSTCILIPIYQIPTTWVFYIRNIFKQHVFFF